MSLIKHKRQWFGINLLHPIHYGSFADLTDGSMQDCSNTIANALELLQSHTKPLKWCTLTLMVEACIQCALLERLLSGFITTQRYFLLNTPNTKYKSFCSNKVTMWPFINFFSDLLRICTGLWISWKFGIVSINFWRAKCISYIYIYKLTYSVWNSNTS